MRTPPDIARPRAKRIAARVEDWFTTNARTFLWRRTPRDPWLSLLSEILAQQTQINRVAKRIPALFSTFPTPTHLADAPEQSILAFWSGLGYYSRARNLHKSAQIIRDEFDGLVPQEVSDLLQLPGVGRYTAGAIASMVFNKRTPIVDGNVRRVLMRIEGADLPQADKATDHWAWAQSTRLVDTCASPARLNEGLMELGAIVCTPRAPKCNVCPLSRSCRARRENLQDKIPAPKKPAARKTVHHAAVIVTNAAGKILAEQRPARGLWANLWQAPTIEHPDRAPTTRQIASTLKVRNVRPAGHFLFKTTHRDVHFHIYRAHPAAPASKHTRGRFLSPKAIAAKPLATPHRRILLEIAPQTSSP